MGQWNRAACLLFQVTSSRTQGKGTKLPQGKFRLDIRKIFFTEKVVRHWNKLSRAMASSLLEAKGCLNNAFNHMVSF